jgi:hypothetical protein
MNTSAHTSLQGQAESSIDPDSFVDQSMESNSSSAQRRTQTLSASVLSAQGLAESSVDPDSFIDQSIDANLSVHGCATDDSDSATIRGAMMALRNLLRLRCPPASTAAGGTTQARIAPESKQGRQTEGVAGTERGVTSSLPDETREYYSQAASDHVCHVHDAEATGGDATSRETAVASDLQQQTLTDLEKIEVWIEENLGLARELLEQAAQRNKRTMQTTAGFKVPPLQLQGRIPTQVSSGQPSNEQRDTTQDSASALAGRISPLPSTSNLVSEIHATLSASKRDGTQAPGRMSQEERDAEATMIRELFGAKDHAMKLLESAMRKLDEQKAELDTLRQKNMASEQDSGQSFARLETALARIQVLEAEKEADAVEQSMMKDKKLRLERELAAKDDEIHRLRNAAGAAAVDAQGQSGHVFKELERSRQRAEELEAILLEQEEVLESERLAHMKAAERLALIEAQGHVRASLTASPRRPPSLTSSGILGSPGGVVSSPNNEARAKRMRELQAQLQEMEDQREADVGRLEAEVYDLKQELAAMSKIAAEREDDAANLRQEIAQLRRSLPAGANLGSTVPEQEQEQEQVAGSLPETQVLKEQLASAEKSAFEAQQAVRIRDAQLKIANEELDRLREENEAIRDLLTQRSVDMERHTGETAAAMESMQILERSVELQGLELKAKDAELSTLKESVRGMESALKNRDAEMQARNMDVITLKEECDRLQRDLDKSQAARQVDAIQAEHESRSLKEQLEKLQDENISMKRVLGTRDAELETLKGETDRLRTGLSSQSTEVGGLEKALSDRDKEVETLLSDAEKLRTRLSKRGEEIDKLEGEVQELKIKLAQQNAHVQQLERDLHEHKSKLAQRNADMETLEETMRTQSSRMAQDAAELLKGSAEKDRLLEESMGAVNRLQSKCREFEELLRVTEMDAERSRKKLEHARMECAKLEEGSRQLGLEQEQTLRLLGRIGLAATADADEKMSSVEHEVFLRQLVKKLQTQCELLLNEKQQLLAKMDGMKRQNDAYKSFERYVHDS